MTKYSLRKLKPKFAILYEEGHEEENNYHVFRIHDFAVLSEERMRRALYPREPKGDYFVFRFDEEVSIGHFNISQYISVKRQEHGFVYGKPLFPKGEELLKYKL